MMRGRRFMRRTRCRILTNRIWGGGGGLDVCFTRRVVLSVLLAAVDETDWLCCAILGYPGAAAEQHTRGRRGV